ncbi:MAG: hypothetical protein EOO05_16435 [Chitinophagaceae bacterium]|nr:MAG: hypothetical protein EOO05_16435 [Chitinophagaceae bacterium]
MKYLILSFLILAFADAEAQFYYNDLENAKTLSARAKALFGQKVKTVTATGYDPQGAKTSDFTEIQDVNPTDHSFRVSTRNGMQVSRVTYNFDAQSNLVSITDKSAGFSTVTSYVYNAAGQLTSIKTTVTDSLNDFSQVDDHQYMWNPTGKPEKLWRILNGRDTSEYRFTLDEKGNVTGEQLFRRNVGFDQVYYYYNDDNQLTDVVRYDKKTRRLLPDFMFEYDDQGRVIQQISTLSATTKTYLIWRYLFNDKGLKTKEALYDKQKELRGRIEYAYVFYP